MRTYVTPVFHAVGSVNSSGSLSLTTETNYSPNGALRILELLLGLLTRLRASCVGAADIVGAQIYGAQNVEGDLAVEAETLEANSGHRLSVAVDGREL